MTKFEETLLEDYMDNYGNLILNDNYLHIVIACLRYCYIKDIEIDDHTPEFNSILNSICFLAEQ
jgi:hypothetical protein